METSSPATSIATELKALYKKWPEVKRFLRTMGCPGNDAEDIFQEALLIYSRKREEQGFVLTVDPFFYVRNTCKLLWYNMARKQEKRQTGSLEIDVANLDDDWMEKEQKLRLVELSLAKLGEQCRELLQLFYGKGWNMTDIAAKIGLRNDKVAKVQKFRCLQKARDIVMEHPESFRDVNVEPPITQL